MVLKRFSGDLFNDKALTVSLSALLFIKCRGGSRALIYTARIVHGIHIVCTARTVRVTCDDHDSRIGRVRVQSQGRGGLELEEVHARRKNHE